MEYFMLPALWLYIFLIFMLQQIVRDAIMERHTSDRCRFVLPMNPWLPFTNAAMRTVDWTGAMTDFNYLLILPLNYKKPNFSYTSCCNLSSSRFVLIFTAFWGYYSVTLLKSDECFELFRSIWKLQYLSTSWNCRIAKVQMSSYYGNCWFQVKNESLFFFIKIYCRNVKKKGSKVGLDASFFNSILNLTA